MQEEPHETGVRKKVIFVHPRLHLHQIEHKMLQREKVKRCVSLLEGCQSGIFLNTQIIQWE